MPKASSELQQIEILTESGPKQVKIVVFDDRNRVLTVKSGNRFVLPGGRIEWDDDDAESAVRREVFEAANIALGIVKPVTVIKTKSRQNLSTQTIVFVGRLCGKGQASRDGHRFMGKETLFNTPSGRGDLVRSLIKAAYRILITEEIRDEYAETAQTGREKYNLHPLL